MVHSLPGNITRGVSNVPSFRGRYDDRGQFPGKECTKQLLLYLLTGEVKANFSRDTITFPNLIMAQCNVKANFRESRDTITLPNLIMAQ